MRIALITDAWQPQVNGVVTTLVELVREMKLMGRVNHIATEGPVGWAASRSHPVSRNSQRGPENLAVRGLCVVSVLSQSIKRGDGAHAGRAGYVAGRAF